MFDPALLLAERYRSCGDVRDWSDGLLRTPGSGHTREVHELASKHDGRHNANFYAAMVLYGDPDLTRGAELLEGLAALQVIDPSDPQYGGFRWYREESRIADTNGAFFIMQPLTVVRLLYADKIPAAHIPLIDALMRAAVHWFAGECAHPSLYYPNKIMSDGALLAAMGVILGDDDAFDEAARFWRRWDEYTDRRGWGWGENLSFGYSRIIAEALRIAQIAFRERERELAAALDRRLEELFERLRFHGGREFVPTIRSYNYLGEPIVYGWLQTIARVREDPLDILSQSPRGGGSVDFGAIVAFHLFRDLWNERQNLPLVQEPTEPVVRVERIFDHTFAYTWKARNVRLGSVNRYPNIPGCYQRPTWGLGWQSMPLNFLVEGHQVAFSRYRVKTDGRWRCHPGMGHHASYLEPALFTETTLPELRTVSAQDGNCLAAIRSISGLCNKAEEMEDVWTVNRFDGEVREIVVPFGADDAFSVGAKGDNAPYRSDPSLNLGERRWVVLVYPQAAIAFSALATIGLGDAGPRPGEIRWDREDGTLHLRQTVYRGQETLLRQDRLETGWIVLAFDRSLDADELHGELSATSVRDESAPDFEVPRDGWSLIRSIELHRGDTRVRLRFDPHYPER